MPALEPVHGVRVVASPDALDRADWDPDDVTLIWRFAPDEAFATRPGEPLTSVQLDDPHAIIEIESGFFAAYMMPDDVAELRSHCEFDWPATRPALVQGKIAGVPVKVWLPDVANGDVLLVAAAYVDEFVDRLGWSRLR